IGSDPPPAGTGDEPTRTLTKRSGGDSAFPLLASGLLSTRPQVSLFHRLRPYESDRTHGRGRGTAERNEPRNGAYQDDPGRAERRGGGDSPEPGSAGGVRPGLNGVANGRARDWHARPREAPGRGDLQPGQGKVAD